MPDNSSPPTPGAKTNNEDPESPRAKAARSKVFAVPSGIKKMYKPRGVKEEENKNSSGVDNPSPSPGTPSSADSPGDIERQKSDPILSAKIRVLTFDDITANEKALEYLFEFANKTNNAESLELWFEIEKYIALQEKSMKLLGVMGTTAMITPREKATYIYDNFIKEQAPRWVCLDAKTYDDISNKMKSAKITYDTELFAKVMRYVERDIQGDMCLRFKLKYRKELFAVEDLWKDEPACKSEAIIMAMALTKLHSPLLNAAPKHLLNDHDAGKMMRAAENDKITLENVLENAQMRELFEEVAATFDGTGAALELLEEINDFELEENPSKKTANSTFANWIVGTFIATNASKRVTMLDEKLTQRVQETITKTPNALSRNVFWSIKQVVKKWLYASVFFQFLLEHGVRCQRIMKAELSKKNKTRFILNKTNLDAEVSGKRRSTPRGSVTSMSHEILGNVAEYKGHMHELLEFEAAYLGLGGQFYATGQTVVTTSKKPHGHDDATIALLKCIKEFETFTTDSPTVFAAMNAATDSKGAKPVENVNGSEDTFDLCNMAHKVYRTVLKDGAGFAIRPKVQAYVEAVFACKRTSVFFPEMFFKLKMDLVSHIMLMAEPERVKNSITSSARVSIKNLGKTMSKAMGREREASTAEVKKVLVLEDILQIPEAHEALSEFAHVNNNDEGLFLIDALEEYDLHTEQHVFQVAAEQIYDMYLVAHSPMWVCTDSRTMEQIEAGLEAGADALTFDDLRIKVMKDLNCDLVRRFRNENPESFARYADILKHRNDPRKRGLSHPLTALRGKLASTPKSRANSEGCDENPTRKLSNERAVRTKSFILEKSATCKTKSKSSGV